MNKQSQELLPIGNPILYKGFKARIIQAWFNYDGHCCYRVEIIDPNSTLRYKYYNINTSQEL